MKKQQLALFYIFLLLGQEFHVVRGSIAAESAQKTSHKSSNTDGDDGMRAANPEGHEWGSISKDGFPRNLDVDKIVHHRGSLSNRGSEEENRDDFTGCRKKLQTLAKSIEQQKSDGSDISDTLKKLRAAHDSCRDATSAHADIENREQSGQKGDNSEMPDHGQSSGSVLAKIFQTLASKERLGQFFRSGLGGCACFLLLSFVSYLGTITNFGMSNGYTLIPSGTSRSNIVRGAGFLYWFVMPAIMLLQGYSSTCDGGPPDMAYAIYTGFLAVHAAVAAYGYTFMKVPALFDTTNVMGSLAVLAVLTVLEHFDMATDTMFPGTSAACNSLISDLWMESWEQSAIPRFVLPYLRALQFDGFALTMFIGSAYVPQLLSLTPFTTLACSLSAFLSVGIWATTSWLYGLSIMLVCHALYLIIVVGYSTTQDGDVPVLVTTLRLWFASDESIATYAGILIFDLAGIDLVGDPVARLGLTGSTKLIFENLIQLWIQSSAFGLSFAHLMSTAKTKALISIGLGLAVSASKIGPLFFLIAVAAREACQARSWFLLFMVLAFGLGPVVLLAIIPWFWIIAKIYFAFSCDSHVWNISSGCVKQP